MSAQLLLITAAVAPDDSDADFRERARLISAYLDLVLARRIVNNMSVQAPDFEEEAERLLPAVRQTHGVSDLRVLLGKEVAALEEDFSAITMFSLRDNRRQVRYLLARLTAFVERGSGRTDEAARYLGQGPPDEVPWEVEHIWANKFERYQSAEVANERQFQKWRDHIGALLLLSKPDNASFGADTYEAKLHHYQRRNLLAGSLHPDAYVRDPGFKRFREQAGLTGDFHPYPDGFDVTAIKERARLYRRLCECIWDPARLGFFLPKSALPPERRRTRAHYKVTLGQLVRASLLQEGAALRGSNKGVLYKARIVRGGRVQLDSGEAFDSPSTAGSAALGRQSCNGWTFWHTNTDNGLEPLAAVRKRALAKGVLEQ